MESLSFDASELRSSNVSRRTILKGVAWSVPAVMVAQVPSWAQTSGTPDITIDFGDSEACKIPGSSWGDPPPPGRKAKCYDKGYVLWASIVNNTGEVVEITGAFNMTVGGVTQCVVGIADPATLCTDDPVAAGSIEIPPTGLHIGIFSNADTDSGSDTVSLQLSYEQGGVPDTTPLLSGDVTGSPWTTGVGSCTFPPNSCGFGGNVMTPIPVCGDPCHV